MTKRIKVSYAVLLDSPSLHFNASHAITFTDAEGNLTTEAIHGHDFRVSVRIEGPLNPKTSCVVDFISVQDILLAIIAEWDHKIILSKGNASSSSSSSKDTPFHNSFVRWIDADNATAEEIAYLILEELVEKIDEKKLLAEPKESYGFILQIEEAPGCFVEVSARGELS